MYILYSVIWIRRRLAGRRGNASPLAVARLVDARDAFMIYICIHSHAAHEMVSIGRLSGCWTTIGVFSTCPTCCMSV